MNVLLFVYVYISGHVCMFLLITNVNDNGH
jgi:hypothetical protein